MRRARSGGVGKELVLLVNEDSGGDKRCFLLPLAIAKDYYRAGGGGVAVALVLQENASEGKKVSFRVEDEVHTVPNQQQEDRYGTWMADGIRESRQKTSRPARKLADAGPLSAPREEPRDRRVRIVQNRDGEQFAMVPLAEPASKRRRL